MTLLALDLGTKLGVAIGDKKISFSNAINLTKLVVKGRPAPAGLHIALNDLYEKHKFNQVVVEVVRFSGRNGVKAVHFFGALLFILQDWCFSKNIPLGFLEICTIKKMFTGMGKATKEDMIGQAKKIGFFPSSSDQADAIAGWWVAKNYPDLIKVRI